MSNAEKSFDRIQIDLTVILCILYNIYFDNLIKLFSDLYLAKFLNTSAESFF